MDHPPKRSFALASRKPSSARERECAFLLLLSPCSASSFGRFVSTFDFRLADSLRAVEDGTKTMRDKTITDHDDDGGEDDPNESTTLSPN